MKILPGIHQINNIPAIMEMTRNEEGWKNLSYEEAIGKWTDRLAQFKKELIEGPLTDDERISIPIGHSIDALSSEIEEALSMSYDNIDEENWFYKDPTGTFSFETFWLGGAEHIRIIRSMWKTTGNMCSPCLPDQVDLDSPNDMGFDAYCLPRDWTNDVEKPYIFVEDL